ncbi:MAG: hypothetical protein JWR54_2128 [Mucilaginibacter sp.]|nr:hypothetical protein [Mucilaginibacter sp.]
MTNNAVFGSAGRIKDAISLSDARRKRIINIRDIKKKQKHKEQAQSAKMDNCGIVKLKVKLITV